ncbi:MAG: ribonuclease HII [Nanoarchaeota archaeon]
MIICGVDEAGRGPLIGPLMIAGVAIDEKDHYKLVQMGVKDSKQLSPRMRKALSRKIRAISRWKLVEVSPKEVDNSVLSKSDNLNWLEAKVTADILRELQPDKAWLDCPSPNLRAYRERVSNDIGEHKIKLIAEHKADENYPVASAASIIAKAARDDYMKKLESRLGLIIGSGYPADPRTQKFLKEHGKTHPDIFRKSWASWKAVSQMKLGEF